MKEKLKKFSENISNGVDTKKKKDFVSEMLYGLLASSSCYLSNIARSLKEEITLKATEKRLSRNLDEFNTGLANCTSEAERQQYALNWLSQSGLAELNEEYHKNNQATIDLSVADQKLTDSKGKLATALTSTVGPALATAKNGLADLGNALASSLSMFASGDVEGGTQVISNALTSLVSNISTMLPQMLTLGTNLIRGLLGGIQEALPELLPVVVETITSFIVKHLSTFSIASSRPSSYRVSDLFCILYSSNKPFFIIKA